ncbi:Protein dpy-30 [Boothiomyces sp. JEL0866]|nr:Protein dpy-30 [Boothiomyces sp. JEL0866]KAJ3325235.1 Protein dpy-30 [Boothiomyces sp. JEL0866]
MPDLESVTGLKNIEDIIAAAPSQATEKVNLNSLPLRAYIDQTVLPVLVEGLKLISKERPPNPIEYLGVFFLKNSENANK